MTVWFVSRHPGAVAWGKHHDLAVDRWVTHLDVADVAPGDFVVGSLPVAAAAEICEKGARFFSLTLSLAESDRGRELSEAELERLHCKTEEFIVIRRPHARKAHGKSC